MYTRRIAAHRTRSRQKLSACRESRYDRPADVRMPPEEFFDNRVPLAVVCPETALMYAVLEDAFLCYQQRLELEGPRIPRAQQAEEWFF
ncbi:MAG: hypothetical protein OEM58_13225, partial [Nitrospirota bacterium]|nr:hypothetical protein [Nitrospirota bacterium]